MSTVATSEVRTATMRAIVMSEFGGPDVLQETTVPLPEPGPGEVRVKVQAVTANTTRDSLTRSGTGAFSRFVRLPHILGGEHAGVVDSVGPSIDSQLIGRRVAVESAYYCGTCQFCASGAEQACSDLKLLGVHRPGAYAEYSIVRASSLYDMPDDMSFVDAAVLMTSGPVAAAQVRIAEIDASDIVVITGISGALGSMVAALAAVRGAKVIGLARDVARATALPLAADVVLDARADDLDAQLAAAATPTGPTAVVDNVCVEPAWAACLRALAPTGRVVISGTVGDGVAGLDTRSLNLRNQSIFGVRTCGVSDQRAFWRDAVAGFRLPGELIQTFPLDKASEVHRQIESSNKRGHYALTLT